MKKIRKEAKDNTGSEQNDRNGGNNPTISRTKVSSRLLYCLLKTEVVVRL